MDNAPVGAPPHDSRHGARPPEVPRGDPRAGNVRVDDARIAGARTDDARDAQPAEPVVWVNGRPSDTVGPHVSALDRGFTLGDGLFETMRAYRGTIFRAEQHLARLRAGAAAFGLERPEALEATLDGAVDAGRRGGLRDAVVRLTVSRGVGVPGVAPAASSAPTVVVAVHPLRRYDPGVYTSGLSAHVATGRRNERAQTVGLKTLAYADAVAALDEARRTGFDDALFLDTEGHVSEATSSNVFLMRRGTLVTPPTSCGILPGITRAAVLEIVAASLLPHEESATTLEELYDASEAFLTSSVREVVPLVRVAGHTLGDGTPGPVTQRIMAAYGELVFHECVPWMNAEEGRG
jgi:branched-chain amino acid aminotransferase